MADDNYILYSEDDPLFKNATVTPNGMILIKFFPDTQIQISLNMAIRMINYTSNTTLALSGLGGSAAFIHPNGKVFQYAAKTEVLIRGTNNCNKYAKMSSRGITFKSDESAFTYLVDQAGVRSTFDIFSDLEQDFSLQVFYSENNYDQICIENAKKLLRTLKFWKTTDDIIHWELNEIHIFQYLDNSVRVNRNNVFLLQTSPGTGSATMITPYVNCSTLLKESTQLYVSYGQQTVHYYGSTFELRDGGKVASLNYENTLTFYAL